MIEQESYFNSEKDISVATINEIGARWLASYQDFPYDPG